MEDLSDDILDMHISAIVSEMNMIGFNLKEWWVDTGATRHIYSDKMMFTSYNEVKNGDQLYMGNSTTSVVEGKGTMVLKMTSEKQLTLNNVLYVLDIRKNLIFGSC